MTDKQTEDARKYVMENWGDIPDCDHFTKQDIASLLAAYAAEVEAGKWVDVNERLPEESDWYLVRFEDLINHDPQKPRVEFFHSCLGEWETNPNVIRVTHWMPLPTVPAQQEEQV